MTVKAATKRLKDLGCATGKAKRSKGSRKGTRVLAQSVAPASVQRTGAKAGPALGKAGRRR